MNQVIYPLLIRNKDCFKLNLLVSPWIQIIRIWLIYSVNVSHRQNHHVSLLFKSTCIACALHTPNKLVDHKVLHIRFSIIRLLYVGMQQMPSFFHRISLMLSCHLFTSIMTIHQVMRVFNSNIHRTKLGVCKDNISD